MNEELLQQLDQEAALELIEAREWGMFHQLQQQLHQLAQTKKLTLKQLQFMFCPGRPLYDFHAGIDKSEALFKVDGSPI